MACSLTIPAVVARTKLVTRRDVRTWRTLRAGAVPRVARQLGRHGIGVELYAGRPDLITGTGRRADVRAEVAG